MSGINFAEFLVGREVERLFNQSPVRYGDCCDNPVTGAGYLHGEDPIEPQKRVARRALLAREWFALNGPADAQPLPLAERDIAERKYARGGKLPSLNYIVALFAYSLRDNDWDINSHPNFDDYARGLLLSEELPTNIFDFEELHTRYKPRLLPGLDLYWGSWEPPTAGPRSIGRPSSKIH